MSIVEELNKFITDFNLAWTIPDLDRLDQLVDDSVVFVSPDLESEFVGRATCLQTIRDYVGIAETTEFEVTDTQMHIWDNLAMITLDYKVKYVMNEKSYHERGKEFWTLQKKSEGWQMIWRAMVQNEPVHG